MSDPEGIDLANEQEARFMAVRYAGEVLQSNPETLWNAGQWRVEVTDDGGSLLFTVITLAIDASRSPDPAIAS
nr:hypothetical protein [Sphingomonas profundi]